MAFQMMDEWRIIDLWFHNHFLCYVPSTRPLLLLLDGYSSHCNPTTVRKAAEDGVILFTLLPHTTHLSQLLDNWGVAVRDG